MSHRAPNVDDEPANVRLLQRILGREGDFKCDSTLDPRETLPIYTAHRPDIVLPDMNMPHLDGMSLLGAFAARFPSRILLRIIFFTADTMQETKHRARPARANDFLTKPFDGVEVLLRIRQRLEGRRLHLRVTEHRDIARCAGSHFGPNMARAEALVS